MTTEKRKAAFYIATKEKANKEAKPSYVMNLWKNEYSYGVTISQEVTEEQWIEIYREARKGKEGKFWIEMKAPKGADSAPAKKKDDSDAPF